MFRLVHFSILLCFFVQNTQSFLIVLPNSTIFLNCSLQLTCDFPIWRIGNDLYSSYGLSSVASPYSINDDGNLIIYNIQSDMNGTDIQCIKLFYDLNYTQFYLSPGNISKLIIANIPDQTLTPFYNLDPDCSVVIRWIAPFDNHKPIRHFLIRYSKNGFVSVINTTSPLLLFRFNNVTLGIVYTVQVAAVNLVGEGLYSSPLTFQIPHESPPLSCIVSSVSQNAVSVSWETSNLFTELMFNITYVLLYYSNNLDVMLIRTESSSEKLVSLKDNTRYFINVSSLVSGFEECITQSTCNLVVTTESKPTNTSFTTVCNVYFAIFCVFLYCVFDYLFA